MPELVPDPLLPELEPPMPDLLKCASHSCRDTCPSLFLSTDEKVGVEELEAPALEDPPVALGEEELEAPPEALPEDLLSVALGLELLDPDAPVLEPEVPELCAIATLASAKSAAAVAVPTTLNDI